MKVLKFVTLLIGAFVVLSCSKNEPMPTGAKKQVEFSFSPLEVEEVAMRVGENPAIVHYIVTEKSTGKEVVVGDVSIAETLMLELLPAQYKCKFYIVGKFGNTINVKDIKTDKYYTAEKDINITESGLKDRIQLKRFISSIQIVKSKGLELLTWISIKATITSAKSINLIDMTKSDIGKWDAVCGGADNYLFPDNSVRVDVVIHSDLTGVDYAKFFRNIKVEANKKYKVTVKLIGGNSDGTDIGGMKASFDIEEDWNGVSDI